MPNDFNNPRVESWYRWIFRRNEHLNQVSIYFLSKRYSTSPRFFPLYDNSTVIRVVLFRGSRIRGVDRAILTLIPIFVRIFRRKFATYEYMHLFSLGLSSTPRTNQILHFDDPEYSLSELESIKSWELRQNELGFESHIVCTSKYTEIYLKNGTLFSFIHVIPQGHSSEQNSESGLEGNSKIHSPLRLVYASPYMHAQGDVHQNHPNWDCTDFFTGLIPLIIKLENVEIHLIGEVGDSALRLLPISENLILHGPCNFVECSLILRTCDVGLYPRRHDNFRQAQKISEYAGAGLAVVGYKLIDCSLVDELSFGILVDNPTDFVRTISSLNENRKLLAQFRESSRQAGELLSWRSLAKRLDCLVRREIKIDLRCEGGKN